MYDTILFPTDGSETATEAADHAIDLATRLENGLTGLVLSTTVRTVAVSIPNAYIAQ